MIQVFRVQNLGLKADLMKEDNVIQYKNLGVVSLKGDIYPDQQTGNTIFQNVEEKAPMIFR